MSTLPKPRSSVAEVSSGDRGAAPEPSPLRLNGAGLALLEERLRAANRDNPDFAAQRDRLLAAVTEALDGLLRHFAPEIERVLAIGAWARDGIDLRTLPEVEDLVLEIVVRADERDGDFDERVSVLVLADIQDRYIQDFLFQFTVLPLPLWRHALEYAAATGRGEDSLGIPLLVRA